VAADSSGKSEIIAKLEEKFHIKRKESKRDSNFDGSS
jgi:acyl carrier protein